MVASRLRCWLHRVRLSRSGRGYWLLGIRRKSRSRRRRSLMRLSATHSSGIWDGGKVAVAGDVSSVRR